MEHQKVMIDADKCIGCGMCAKVCAEQIDKEDDIRLNPDDVLEVIRFRRTIRQFRQKEIPREIIEQILEEVSLFKKIKKTIKVPEGKKAAMTLVLGFPAVNYLRSVQRKALDVNYM